MVQCLCHIKILLCLVSCFPILNESFAQEIPNQVIEQQFENISEAENAEPEDDSYHQQLQQLRKNPLNINVATESDLQVFRWLSDLQVKNLLHYRTLLGNFLTIYELQSIPGWDIESINITIPFITVSKVESLKENIRRRLKAGDHTILFRFGQVLERSKGYIPENDST